MRCITYCNQLSQLMRKILYVREKCNHKTPLSFAMPITNQIVQIIVANFFNYTTFCHQTLTLTK